MTAEQILDAIAPQFITNTNKSAHLTLAAQRTSRTCFGINYELAVALRAAHTLTLSTEANAAGGSSGGISSKREGDLAISFGGQSSTGVTGDLGQTSYGVQLQQLIDSNIVGINITGININCDGSVTLPIVC